MSTSGTATLDSSFDRFSYTKVGRLVTIIGNPRISSVSSPVGIMTLTLPFTSQSVETDESRAGFVQSYYDASAGSGSYYKQMNAYVLEGTSTLTLANTHSSNNIVTPAASDEFYFSFTYMAT